MTPIDESGLYETYTQRLRLVRLNTYGGSYVTDQWVLPALPPHEIVRWGARTFVRTGRTIEDSVGREVLIYKEGSETWAIDPTTGIMKTDPSACR
jgi:hypothetical protein